MNSGLENDLRKVIHRQIDLAGLKKNHMRAEKEVIDGQGVEPYVVQDGKKMLQMTSLDYLSLASDSRVIDAGCKAMKEYGVGSLPSPIVTGTLDIHIQLRKLLASYMNEEDAIVFSSGMLTNIGTIQAIIDPIYRYAINRPEKTQRVIFADALNHESIKMACWLAENRGVAVHTYRHCDIQHLDHLMCHHAGDLNLIVTDAMFSMEGDIAPLKPITQIAESFRTSQRQVVVYVDDAHGVGVLGDNGRGACELCGVEQDVVRMGVVSKAFGTLGGYIVGPEWFIDFLCYSSSQIFSMGVPAAETASTITAINIAISEPWRRQKLLENSEYLRKNLIEAGFEVLGDVHIISVIIGGEKESSQMAAGLKKNGILCPEIKYPAVALGKARMRISPVSAHSKSDLDLFLNVFVDVAKTTGVVTCPLSYS